MKLAQLAHQSTFEEFVLQHPKGKDLLLQLFIGLEECMKCLFRHIGFADETRRTRQYFAALRSLQKDAVAAATSKRAMSLTAVSMLQGEYAKIHSKLPHLQNEMACQLELTNLGMAIVALWNID